ncbi:MAG: DUF4349 domain-containing protein [Bacilli bacterium]
MKKKLILLLLIVGSLFLISCKKESVPEDVNHEINESEFTSSGRLIVYNISANIQVENVNESLKNIKSLLNVDEWIAYETQSSGYSRITLRIKTTRLDNFLSQLSDSYTLDNLNRSSIDVSLNYYDLTSRITALESQRERLVVLYETASFNDILVINEQISIIDSQLHDLTRQKNEYDSNIEYSSINLFIQSEETDQKYSTFFTESVLSIWKVLLKLGGLILIAIVAFIPLAIIIIPIVVISKKKAKKNKFDFTKYDK